MTDSDAVRLAFRQYSDSGPALLVLHGLFGSHTNWGWHNRHLASNHAVFGLDLRNHGDSPHSNLLNYPVMAEDIRQFMAQQGLGQCAILGHSMGGKVAMQLALETPHLVNRLVVVDIAPAGYPQSADGHQRIISGLRSLDLASLSSRGEADIQLGKVIEDSSTRQFLLTNLVRNRRGVSGYQWRLNLDAIESSYQNLRSWSSPGKPFDGPCLFIKGGNSDYIKPQHKNEILNQFPSAEIKIITGAGHWVHAEKPRTLHRVVADFLNQ
ncbi:MAG: alpha/beta fold hydrolase [Gammaproteobacteria bacterium]|nr:alpha/beta fold hydrolase [Gammaproteobacteria bacterium]